MNCPNCGEPWVKGGDLWICGTQDLNYPTIKCQNFRLKRELKQANAVSDAIATLIGNGTTSISIYKVTVQGGEIAVNIDDNTGPFSTTVHRDTLREALEACVKARNKHDKDS